MLKKNLLTIFLLGTISSGVILMMMTLSSQNIFCLDNQGCDDQQQCHALMCKDHNQDLKVHDLKIQTIKTQDHLNTKNIPEKFKAPMDTFCQKSCEYHHLSKKALFNQYGLSSVPIEFQKNHEIIKTSYQSAYHDCMSSVEIELEFEKNNHCLKTAHSVCVMQCENETTNITDLPPISTLRSAPVSSSKLTAELPHTEIMNTLKSQLYDIKLCLHKDRSLLGNVKLQLEIEHSGDVLDAIVKNDPFAGSIVGNCIEAKVKKIKFLPFSNASMRVTIPYFLTVK